MNPNRGSHALGFAGQTVLFEWSGACAARVAGVLLGQRHCRSDALPDHVFRLHEPLGQQILTAFGDTECLYRGPDLGIGAHQVMDTLMSRLARECFDGMILHAAMLSYQGKGVLIAGPSGAGKSTWAAVLATSGLTYHGDEMCFIPATDIGHAFGLYRPLCLKGGWRDVIPALDDARYLSLISGPQTLIDIGALVCSTSDEPVVPALIVFPAYDAIATGTPAPLSPAKAVMRLIASTMNGANLPQRGMNLAGDIARLTPAYEIRCANPQQMAHGVRLVQQILGVAS